MKWSGDKVACHAKCNIFSSDSEKKKKINEKERKVGETCMVICHKIMNFSEDYERLYLSKYI